MAKNKPLRLLGYFDYNVPTGFATVSENIIRQLKRHYRQRLLIDIVAVNYLGPRYQESDDSRYGSVVNVIPGLAHEPEAPEGEEKDKFCRKSLLKCLTEGTYDAVFMIQDVGIVLPMLEVMAQIRKEKAARGLKGFKTILYFPIDGPSQQHLVGNMDAIDYPVAYTRFGAETVLQVHPGLRRSLRVIPHGVDTTTFRPLEYGEREDFREAYFGENAGRYIIGNVNRNQFRKNIPATMFAFAEYYKRNPQAYLYLHLDPHDHLGWDVEQIAQQLGLVYGEHYQFPTEQQMIDTDNGFMNCIYNSLDVFLNTTAGEGWGLCVDPNTLITTTDGVVPMRHIQPGHSVLTEDGTFRAVKNKVERKDQTLILKALSVPPVIITPQHPFLAVKGTAALLKSQKLTPPQWVEAKDLRKGDLVAIVKPKLHDRLPEDRIDLTEWVEGIEYNDTHCWYRMGFSPDAPGLSISAIAKKYNVSKRVAEDARNTLNGKKRAMRGGIGTAAYALAVLMKEDGVVADSQPVKINRYIPINDKFLELVGWYLAEGSAGGGTRMEIDLHRDEMPVAEMLGRFGRELFGATPVVEPRAGKRCVVRFSSGIVAKFLRHYCGQGAKNKHINERLYRCADHLAPLLRGLILGDGCLHPTRISFTSVSAKLAWQLRDVLLSQGIFCCISSYFQTNGVSKNPFWVVSINGDSQRKVCQWLGLPYSSTIQRKRAQHYLEDENYYYVRIKSIDPHKSQQTVMDIEVEGVHSFVGNGLVLHNTNVEAMAAGVPVLAPLHTSLEEIAGRRVDLGEVPFDSDREEDREEWAAANGPGATYERLYGMDRLLPYCNQADNQVRLQPVPADVADMLQCIDHRPHWVDRMVERAGAYAYSLDWSTVARQWIKIFDTL